MRSHRLSTTQGRDQGCCDKGTHRAIQLSWDLRKAVQVSPRGQDILGEASLRGQGAMRASGGLGKLPKSGWGRGCHGRDLAVLSKETASVLGKRGTLEGV